MYLKNITSSRLCTLVFAICTIFLFSCDSETEPPVDKPTVITGKEASPAGPWSTEPNLLVGANGKVYLSWVEKVPDELPRLYFSVREDANWSKPVRIAEGEGLFGNWANFPSLIVNKEGQMLVQFSRKGKGHHAADVMLSLSRDGGANWSAPFTAHDDGTPTEHGFFSGLPMEDGRFRIFWLDGRNTHEGGHSHGHGHGHGEDHHTEEDVPPSEMNLRAAIVDSEGNIKHDAVIDGRVCDCCQTDAVMTARGEIVVYRDRSAGEHRDIGIVRKASDGWTSPEPVHPDGWEIAGCPVNGPQADAIGSSVAVAWFTMANDTPQVRLAFSANDGAAFDAPIRIDGGEPIGRVAVALADAQTAVVLWMEQQDTLVDLKMKLVTNAGEILREAVIATLGPGRSTGFPAIVRKGRELIVAWTEAGDRPQVKTDVISLPEA